jgi:acetyl esterase/lipase
MLAITTPLGAVAARLALAALLGALGGCMTLGFTVANTTTALATSYERSADQAYGADPRQKLDVYRPVKAAGLRPVVVFWYGGSWTSGDRGAYRFVGAALADRGYVTVIPDYRLYPQVRFPAFVEDGLQALAWVRQHARQFGGDANRIVLMGHSAGAHQAAFVAYDRQRLAKAGIDPAAIIGLIGLSGPYALDPNSDLLNTIFAPPYTHADWQPVRLVAPGAPPTLLVHGMADTVVTIRHAQRLQQALQTARVRVDARFYPGKSHVDTVAGFAVATRGWSPALADSVAFIESLQPPSTAKAPE